MKPFEALEEFNKYKDLEEQGRLLKLPVAVGDKAYRVKREHNALSVKLHANINEETYPIWIDGWFDRFQIGHGFFLTREEAEAALKERDKQQI